MSPYSHPVTKITDVSPYFQKNSDFSMTFIGKTLELRIPRVFSGHGMLLIGDGSVMTLGVMDMIIDEQYQTGLNLLAQITIEPSDVGQMTYKGLEYVVLKLKTGDKFMTSHRVIRDPKVVYTLWTEFVTYGKLIYTFDYDGLLKMFDHVRELTGEGIGVSRSVYEGIIAHLCRDRKNLALQYRLTPMKQPMELVPLNSVSRGPSGTLARLNGSYFRDEGTTSALLYDVDTVQPFEQILRGISSSTYEDPDAAIV